MHSAAFGLWLHGGSRQQSRLQSGYAHLLEHLLFKGTKTLNGMELRRRFAALGGAVNAQTGREFTAWYGLVALNAVRECLTLFVEMLLEPGFTDTDVRVERQVVLREIAEKPPDLAELCLARLWPRHPLGWPVRGHRDILETADVGGLRAFLREQRQGRRLVVSAGGSVDHGELVEICRPLAQLPAGTAPVTLPPLWQAPLDNAYLRPDPTQILWVIPVPAIRDNRYTTFQTLVFLLAGGPASRLYEALREHSPWVYGFESAVHGFTDAGVWLLRVQCAPARAEQVTKQVEQAFKRLATDPPTAADLELWRRHFHARLDLEQDDPQAVMERLGRETLLLGGVRDTAQLHNEIEKVQAEEVSALAAEWLPTLIP